MVLLKEGNLISQSLSLIPKLKARTTKKSGTNCHKKKTEKTKMWGYYVLQSKNSMEAVKVMMPFYEKSEKEQENLLTVKDLNNKTPLHKLVQQQHAANFNDVFADLSKARVDI